VDPLNDFALKCRIRTATGLRSCKLDKDVTSSLCYEAQLATDRVNQIQESVAVYRLSEEANSSSLQIECL